MQLLPWLPTHSDMSAALASARRTADATERLAAIISLAGHNRDFLATDRIDRLLSSTLDGGEVDLHTANLHPVRVAILASHTMDHLLPAIRVAGLQRRLAVQIHLAPYGMYRQALLGGDAELDAFAPQFVLLALDAHDSPLNLPLDAPEEQVDAAIRVRVNELRQLWARAAEHKAQVIQQTLLSSDMPVFGSFEALVPASPTAVVERLNNAIRSAAREDKVLLLDLAWQAQLHRTTSAFSDPVRWHQAKQLVSPMAAPVYGDLVGRMLSAALGRSAKALILDLDNTLWGGVIGDDGIDGIRLGQGHPTGEAFLAFQRYVSTLSRRGIILAVCSKNDAAVAEAAFAGHPEMAIRRNDIAAFVANWDDKATNLRLIAQTLNVGLDSLVFVDDNPAERHIVRTELPEVSVPELPDDVAYYPQRLAAAGYFEAAGFTSDDVSRGQAYAANAARQAELDRSTDLDSYLRSLEMVASVVPLAGPALNRGLQLLNKTNQFNLTTQRYTDTELAHRLSVPGSIGLMLRLQDRFGDNGLIALVTAIPAPEWGSRALLIDNWIMSCRVLGRGMEAATLCALLDIASANGWSELVGRYRPTGRNRMVAEHYRKLGFRLTDALAEAAEDETYWMLNINDTSFPNHHVSIGE